MATHASQGLPRAEGPGPSADTPPGAVPPGAPPIPPPRALTRRLVRAAGDRGNGHTMSVGELIATLGDRSFGWCIVIFALINLVPMPLGGSMITSLPLILVAAQMALGLSELRLPPRVMRRQITRKGFQKAVMRLRPLMRPIERAVRPRHEIVFAPRNERLIGLLLLAVAIALFLPIPLSGYLPAAALFVTGIGLVERDGLVAVAGMAIGILSIAITAGVGLALVLGARLLAA